MNRDRNSDRDHQTLPSILSERLAMEMEDIANQGLEKDFVQYTLRQDHHYILDERNSATPFRVLHDTASNDPISAKLRPLPWVGNLPLLALLLAVHAVVLAAPVAGHAHAVELLEADVLFD